MATLALIARGTTGVLSGVGQLKARYIWNTAQDLASGSHPKPLTLWAHEKLVFETLSVDEAFAQLSLASTIGREDEEGRMYTPLQILSCLIVKERVKKHFGKLFVHVVTDAMTMNDEEDKGVAEEEEARRLTVEAARELGGYVGKLGRALERVWKTTSIDDDDLTYFAGLESETKALFTALVLYRRVFGVDINGPSSTLLSPPPSPILKMCGQHDRMLLELRKALGNRAFEETDVLGLEDARDYMVDMIVDRERFGVSM